MDMQGLSHKESFGGGTLRFLVLVDSRLNRHETEGNLIPTNERASALRRQVIHLVGYMAPWSRRRHHLHGDSGLVRTPCHESKERVPARLRLLMRLDELEYDLPAKQVAQRPLDRRDASRLLLLNRSSGAFEDLLFAELPEILQGNELMVLNNARVIPARLFGHRAGVHSQKPSRSTRAEHLTGTVEILLSRQVEPDVWEALVRPGRKMHIGERVFFGVGELEGEVIARGEFGLRTLRFISNDQHTVNEHIERLGHVPLPPYIGRVDDHTDRERYQTVFAKHPGAIAAPTAGLHFSP